MLFLVFLLLDSSFFLLVGGSAASIGTEVAAMTAAVTLPNGSPCDFSSQCLTGSYCGDGQCRKASCRHNFECNASELCRFGRVDGELRSACFPFDLGPKSKSDFCPGGGRPTLNSGGFVETCSLEVPCVGSRSICNPVYGVCCTKLRACPFPRQPVLESESHRPVVCQLRGSRQLECPPESDCIRATGFCCAHDQDPAPSALPPPAVELPQPDRPAPGERCDKQGAICAGNALCECKDGECECRCSRSMGYSLDVSRRVCRRMRRRLKERCKYDLECQSAFSECSSGGCRCKAGFQRDGRGGCKPVAYKCVNNAEPLKYDGSKVIACVSAKNERDIETAELLHDDPQLFANSTGTIEIVRSKRETRDCPSQHYCVGIFDVPKQPHLIQGFCCPLPEPERPVCPVGNAHSSSQPPHYGCSDCPWDFFCHVDDVATKKKICCPKPCLSPEDVYIKGQCFAIAYHGDSCSHNEQCVGKTSGKKRNGRELEAEEAEMECVEGVCGCPSGFLLVDGVCKHLTCTTGLRTAPSLDSAGRVIECDRNADCSAGHVCDFQLHVCCKGSNQCPKGYAETGRLCEADNLCETPDEVCVRTRKGKQRICCKLEE